METSVISGLNINDTEYCTVVGAQYYNNSTFKVKVSKLTPFALTEGRQTFNPNILVNDSSVKPSVNKFVNTQKFLTITRSAMCNLIGVTDSKNMVPNGTVLKCSCQNGDFTKLTITDAKI